MSKKMKITMAINIEVLMPVTEEEANSFENLSKMELYKLRKDRAESMKAEFLKSVPDECDAKVIVTLPKVIDTIMRKEVR